jgi:hypothetical protein
MRSNLVLVCEFDIKMVSIENILILKTDFVFNNFKKTPWNLNIEHCLSRIGIGRGSFGIAGRVVVKGSQAQDFE